MPSFKMADEHMQLIMFPPQIPPIMKGFFFFFFFFLKHKPIRMGKVGEETIAKHSVRGEDGWVDG